MEYVTGQSKTGTPAKLVLETTLVVLLVLLLPSRAAAVGCVGDRTYDTAAADGCTTVTAGDPFRMTGAWDTGQASFKFPAIFTSNGLQLRVENIFQQGCEATCLYSVEYFGCDDPSDLSDCEIALSQTGGTWSMCPNTSLAFVNVDQVENDVTFFSRPATTAGQCGESNECVGYRTYETAVADGCTSIAGDLSISGVGRPPLTDVDGLSALTSVSGHLFISDHDALTNIDGLSALTSVGGIFSITWNDALTNIDGLSALTTVGDRLKIGYNGELTNIDGLSALTSVGGDLQIYTNDSLTNIDGLSALTSVGGDVSIQQNSLCQYNLNDFLSPITVGGELRSSRNTGPCPPTKLFASTLPSSRSVTVDDKTSAYATMINAGENIAYECTITLGSDISAIFKSWATDPATNAAIGSRNPSVDIEAGGFATWAFQIVPREATPPTDIELVFACANTEPATVLPGINTLLLSASYRPTPDIVAIALTATRDGVLWLDGSQASGAFATATINLGVSGSITVEPRRSRNGMPLNLMICETDPAAGTCTSAIGPSVTTTIEADATPTFAVFATAAGTIPFDAANYRIYIEFTDDQGEVRGSSSVAVTTE